jgi:FkbM family methyltransferase
MTHRLHTEFLIDYDPVITKKIIKDLKKLNSSFFLIDVGCSGGISNQWKVIEKVLSGYGIDPLVNGIKELEKNNKNKDFKYIDGYVTDNDKSFHNNNNQYNAFEKYSALKAIELTNYSINQNYNNNENIKFSNKKFSIDELVKKNKIKNIDFIKTDTDGYDYDVLNGLSKTIKSHEILGFMVECPIESWYSKKNNLHNIITFMNNYGYRIYDMTLNRYSNRIFPAHFSYDLYGQTEYGQIAWSDVLFIRDLASWDIKKSPVDKLLKQIIIFEIYSLYDHVFLILEELNRRKYITSNIKEKYFNELCKKVYGLKYSDHIKNFENNPKSFYPSNLSKKKSIANKFNLLNFRKK